MKLGKCPSKTGCCAVIAAVICGRLYIAHVG